MKFRDSNTEKKIVSDNTDVFIISMWGLLRHVSVQRDPLQVTHISKITKKTLDYGCFICKRDLICKNNFCILKGNWGVYRCPSFVDFLVTQIPIYKIFPK